MLKIFKFVSKQLKENWGEGVGAFLFKFSKTVCTVHLSMSRDVTINNHNHTTVQPVENFSDFLISFCYIYASQL
jgi:hypothetical protein